jgi:hypothetical protein
MHPNVISAQAEIHASFHGQFETCAGARLSAIEPVFPSCPHLLRASNLTLRHVAVGLDGRDEHGHDGQTDVLRPSDHAPDHLTAWVTSSRAEERTA